MAKINSGILYRGPSVIDGAPIVCIVIGKSSNSKTGNMVQTYIVREDIDPITANRMGLDYSICGDCIHRGTPNQNGKGLATKRSCYVNIGQGTLQVYKAFKRGAYRMLTADDAKRIGADRMVRMGTYGDPAALPYGAFESLLGASLGHTGYTHQVGLVSGVDTGRLMVSADNQEDAMAAHHKGYRTFRVIPVSQYNALGKNALLHNEILCPASKEMNARVQCNDCKLCSGANTKGKNIAIVAHGATKGNVK